MVICPSAIGMEKIPVPIWNATSSGRSLRVSSLYFFLRYSSSSSS